MDKLEALRLEMLNSIENRKKIKQRIEEKKKFNEELKNSPSNNKVKLPNYTKSPYSNYKEMKGRVMEAHSDLHDNKDGKRTITTKMKIWNKLTPSDKADLKKSIMIAIDHKFKGGSISDFPTDIRDIVKAVSKHFVGKGFMDDMNRIGSTLYPQTARNAEDKVRKIREADARLRARNEQMRQAKGQGLVENYFKPKGHRQLVYFSDSSSEEDEPHLPVKRGRGRPKKM